MPVLRLVPKTCTDAFWGQIQDDDCPHFSQLSNLVPAADTPSNWLVRPGFSTLTGSQFAINIAYTCYTMVNGVAYGMVNDYLNSGNDRPFAYNVYSQTLTVITTGVNTATNCPTSPGTGGWQPPHAECIGTKVIITHPGFNGTNGFFGWIDISNPGALTWTSGNTSTNALPNVPVWVTQFNNRAYYFVNPGGSTPPGVYISDTFASGGPTSRSSAVLADIITFGDNIPLLCAMPQSVMTTAGGVISALYVFKSAVWGNANISQITGDPALGNWTLSPLYVNTSTTAANSVVSTPKGIMFMAPDGVRMIDKTGQVTDPIGYNGEGVCVPFISSAQPSRVAAACNGVVYRICTQNGNVSGAPNQDWCYDLQRNIWYGPHTPGFGLIQALGSTFVCASLPGVWTGLATSSLIPDSSAQYTDFASQAPYTCTYQSTLVPDRREINMLSSVKAVIYVGYGAGTTNFFFTFNDAVGNDLDTSSLQVSGGIGPQWGQFAWGDGTALSASTVLAPFELPLDFPIVFDKVQITVSFTATAGIRLGLTHIEYVPAGYTVRIK